jgi:hypothetical protein
MALPMDIEYQLEWNKRRMKQEGRCQHLSPLKRRRIEQKPDIFRIDHSQIVKCLPRSSPPPRNTGMGRFIPSMSDVPALTIGILHMALNFVIVTAICYSALWLVYSMQRDIGHRIRDRKIQIEHEVAEARASYEINRCDPRTRVPALEKACNEWECIVKNGYGSVGYTRIIMDVIGDVLDSFIRKFSIRSSLILGFFFALFLLCRRKQGS